MNYSAYTDNELIFLLLRGDDHVTDFLLEKYRPLVRRRSAALFLTGGDAEDLNQEGMIGLYQAIRDFDPEKGASFAAFADLCIRRQMFHAVEADTRKHNAPLNGAVPLEDVAPDLPGEEDPETRYIENEERAHLEKQYAGILSAYEQKVLHLYLEGYRYTEIAQILQKTPKSADNAIQRIRGKIMREKEKEKLQV